LSLSCSHSSVHQSFRICHLSLLLSPLHFLPLFCFFFTDTAPTEIYTLSLHDALPILPSPTPAAQASAPSVATISPPITTSSSTRSEEHTSELQSRVDLVCRLLLEKKKKKIKN